MALVTARYFDRDSMEWVTDEYDPEADQAELDRLDAEMAREGHELRVWELARAKRDLAEGSDYDEDAEF